MATCKEDTDEVDGFRSENPSMSVTMSDEFTLDDGNESDGNVTDSSTDSETTSGRAIDIIVHYKNKLRKKLQDFKRSLFVPLTLEKYLKWQYITNNRSLLQQKMAELAKITENVTISDGILEVFLRRQKENYDFDSLAKTLEETLLSDTDSIAVSWFPLKASHPGTEFLQVLNSVVQHSDIGNELYTEMTDTLNSKVIRFVHDVKYLDKAKEITNQAVQEFEKKILLQWHSININLPIVYSHIFEKYDMKRRVRTVSPTVLVFFNIMESKDEFNVELRGEQKDLNRVRKWIEEVFINPYCCLEIGFNEVQTCEESIDIPSVIMNTLERKNYQDLFWTISNHSKKTWICSSKSDDAHEAVQVVKTCVKQTKECKKTTKPVEEIESIVEELVAVNSDIFGRSVSVRVLTEHNKDLAIYLTGEEHQLDHINNWFDSYTRRAAGMETYPDLPSFREKLNRRSLEEHLLEISEVEVTQSIKVKGYDPELSHDVLLFYFENVRRSGGGEVDRVEYQKENNVHIVHFLKSEDAINVCKRQQHKVSGIVISVCLYYPCLDLSTQYRLVVPEPLDMIHLDPYIVRFLSCSSPYKMKFEVSMKKKCFASVVFPSEFDGTLRITCDVDPKDDGAHEKLKDWQSTCRQEVDALCSDLDVNNQIRVAKEVWSGVIERLKNMKISEPDMVMINIKREDYIIVVVGLKEWVVDFSRKISEMVSELEQKLAADQHTITKSKVLKTYEAALLRVIQFTEKSTTPGLSVSMTDRQIEFNGSKTDVDDCMQKMYQSLKEFSHRSVQGYSKTATDLLFQIETRSYISKVMKRLVCVWDVKKGADLVIYSRNEKDLDEVISLLRKALQQKTVPLDATMSTLMRNKEWESHLSQITNNSENKGLMTVEVKLEEIRIVGVNLIIQNVYEEIMKFFDLHGNVSEFMSVEPGRFLYIVLNKKLQLEDIEKQYGSLDVSIERVDKDSRKGFNIYGKKDGCRLAIARLQKFVDNVTYTDLKVSNPGLKDFLLSSEFMSVEPGRFLYIVLNKKLLLEDIEKQYGSLDVCIERVDKDSRKGFNIYGKKDGCRLAIARLQKFVDNVTYTDLKVSNPGLKDFLLSSDGKKQLQNIELSEKCILLPEIGKGVKGDESPMSQVTDMPKEAAACKMARCAVSVMEGDITSLHVDMIVNPAVPSLHNSIGLGSAIVDKGGFDIQKQCDEFVRRKGRLSDAETFISEAGKLPCKRIVHVVMPSWSGVESSEKSVLRKAVEHCLNAAEICNCKSIAMPLIGAGTFRYPLNVAAKNIVEMISRYASEKARSTSIQQIYLCDRKSANVQVFINELKLKLRSSEIQIYKDVVKDIFRPKKETISTVMIHVYADSLNHLENVKRKLDGLFTEHQIYLPKLVLERMEQKEINWIMKIGERKNIDVALNGRDALFTLQGYGPSMQHVETDIMSYISKLEKTFKLKWSNG